MFRVFGHGGTNSPLPPHSIQLGSSCQKRHEIVQSVNEEPLLLVPDGLRAPVAEVKHAEDASKEDLLVIAWAALGVCKVWGFGLRV